ncbi:hypothetical protein C8D88_103181 [Lentzea atacamensis]|uniref:Agd3 CBM87 domain-containing protein n=1 Tax=Lentzea atacamensis TaxID=531938 RepID=A0A316I454_9PSEU|nr:hypothetical protein [Lentzea atacamensis]PWK87985.1 hypothetical protein C8D88_103181 [Lentzea atacamensis]
MAARTKWIASVLATLTAVAFAALPAAGAAEDAARHGLKHGHRHGLIRGDVARPAPPPPPKLRVVNGPLEPGRSRVAGTGKVALRVLVIALDSADFGLSTWKAVLDRIGTPYDVLTARTEQLTADRLVRSDGTGRYHAVLLTDNALLQPDGSGGYVSAFEPAEWQTLWDYERNHRIRQVSLYTSWGTFPEDYCLRPGVEGSVGGSGLSATLTAAGAGVFDRLVADADVPITFSYVYRSTLAPGCAAQPTLMVGDHVLGVVGTSADGRERAALTFSSNEFLPQTDMLGYGLVRWATRGVFTGELRHWINVDVDDWFNSTDHLYPDGHLETDPGFRLSGSDAAGTNAQQNALRAGYPATAGFTLNLPYNGGDLTPSAPSRCSGSGTPDALTSYSKCLKGNFRWVNHTVSHPEMNFLDYSTSRREIADNLTIGRQAGLTVPTDVLKTPAYSGLGVYHPDPNAPDTEPPVDFGLRASNQAMLTAAADVGVRYLHGNMSFQSHRPSCFNCGIRHPLRPELLVVPDWPTNIGYQVTTPAEETLLYNSLYGPNGRFPYYDHDLSYPELLNYESEVALQHVMSGSAYAHTLHQGNLRQFAPGRSLTFDWLRTVVDRYSTRFSVPLRNPDWPSLARYVDARTSHFAEIRGGADAVWDRATNTVTRTSTTTGSLFLTGVTHASGTTDRYGAELITRLPITAGTTVVATAVPRP